MSMDGRTLLSTHTSEDRMELNMAQAPAGMYFVKVMDGGQTYTRKIVKQ